MATVLPVNALIKLKDLNTSAQRNLRKITGFYAVDGFLTIYTPNTTGLTNGSSVVISNMAGASSTITATVSNVLPGSFQITKTLTWPVASVRTYSTATHFYIDTILHGTHTLKPGDVFTLNVGSCVSVTSTACSIASNTNVVFKSTMSFGGTASYPLYSNGISINELQAPSTITLNSTGAIRSPGLSNVYWAIGGGATSITLSDHSRKELKIAPDVIEKGGRLADGTLRTSHIASKNTYSTSWDLLPADSIATVDGFAGGNDLLTVWQNNVGPITMELYNRDSARKGANPDSTVVVKMKPPSIDIVRRNVQSPDGRLTDYWNVSVEFEEV